MKIMLTGASGLLGREIYSTLKDTNEVRAYAFSRTQGDLQKLDLTDEAAVKNEISAFQPDLIIHSAAERSPDVCEKDHDATLALNVQACEYLCKSAAQVNAPLIYISTDYVFDGSQAPYLPGDEANPLNFYGKSKLLGEEVIKKELSHYAILRVPVLYGQVEYPGESAVITLIQSVLKQEKTVQDHWSARYPTYVNDIAVALKDFTPLFKNDISLSATYHFSGNEEVTKFEICQIMAEILGVSGDHISANSSTPAGAPRPQDCHLDDSSLASIISLQKTPFREALAEVISSMKSKDLI